MTSQPLTEQQLADIAARAEAATPGPWAAVELPPNAEFKHPAHWVTVEYTDDQGCSTSEVVADCPWRQSDAEFVAHAREDVPALLAELAAVRAERDRYRERALNAENRSIVDGREVCADCERPVPDGPCGVHSPDAVFQRAAREAAQLRAERDAFRDQRNNVFATNERLLAKVDELGQARLQEENETRAVKREFASAAATVAELVQKRGERMKVENALRDEVEDLRTRIAELGQADTEEAGQ